MCLRRPASGWISADMRIRTDKPTLDDVFLKYAGAIRFKGKGEDPAEKALQA